MYTLPNDRSVIDDLMALVDRVADRYEGQDEPEWDDGDTTSELVSSLGLRKL